MGTGTGMGTRSWAWVWVRVRDYGYGYGYGYWYKTMGTGMGTGTTCDKREISLHVQRRIRVDVGLVFDVKINPYLKIKNTFEIFHQPAVKL